MISQKRLVGLKASVLYRQDGRSRRKKPRKALIVAGLCLLAFSIVIGAIGYPALDGRYRQDMAQAQTGAQELKEGIALLRTLPSHPFDAMAVSKAQRDFGGALTIFSRLSDDLNRVPDVLTLVPVVG